MNPEQPKVAYSFLRFSSARQELNDSVRRQTKITEEYAKEKGFILDETTRLKALKVSGFSGAHIAKGSALDGLLQAAKEGKIPRGTALLVEAMDRLSRLKPADAVQLFIDILKHGIEIHTVKSRMVFTEENINEDISKLYQAVGELFGAHKESKDKGFRVGQVWGEKKEKARKREVATAKVPYWLRVIGRKTINGRKSGGKIIPIDHRVAIVKEIFRLRREGMGKRLIGKTLRIAAELNDKKVKTFGKSEAWHDSYIQNILNSIAVTGRYQPYKVVDGVRKPVGEPIEKYYPRIISDEDFEFCSGKAEITRGAVGDKISNLFGGICFDGTTPKAKMKYLERPGNGKQYKYLYSDVPRLKKGVPVCRWDYVEFENLFLDYIIGVEWEHVAEVKNDASTGKLNIKIEAAVKELEKLKLIDKRFANAIRDGSTSAALREENNKLQPKLEAKRKELADLRKEKSRKSNQTLDVKELRELISKGDFASRVRLRNEIRKMIARIDLYPNGNKKAKIPFPCFTVTFKEGQEFGGSVYLKQNVVTKDGKIIGRGFEEPRGRISKESGRSQRGEKS
jgi:hypothetical protein